MHRQTRQDKLNVRVSDFHRFFHFFFVFRTDWRCLISIWCYSRSNDDTCWQLGQQVDVQSSLLWLNQTWLKQPTPERLCFAHWSDNDDLITQDPRIVSSAKWAARRIFKGNLHTSWPESNATSLSPPFVRWRHHGIPPSEIIIRIRKKRGEGGCIITCNQIKREGCETRKKKGGRGRKCLNDDKSLSHTKWFTFKGLKKPKKTNAYFRNGCATYTSCTTHTHPHFQNLVSCSFFFFFTLS